MKNDGDNDDDGLSDANAWETTSKVNGFSFDDGDHVYFKCNDTWENQQLVIDWPGIDRFNRAVIGAYYMDGGSEVIGVSGNRPIFDGNDTTPGTPPGVYAGLVRIRDVGASGSNQYVTVQDLDVIHSGGEGINAKEDPIISPSIYFNYITIKRCRVYYSDGAGIGFGDSNNVIVEECEVENCGHTRQPAGIAFSYNVINSIIRKNVSFDHNQDAGAECIGVYKCCNNVIVEDNACWDGKAMIEITQGRNIYARRNLCYMTSEYSRSAGIYISDGSLGHTANYTKNIYVYNNLVAYCNLGIATRVQASPPTTDMSGILIYNNTVVDSWYHESDGKGANYDLDAQYNNQPVGEVKNNISWLTSEAEANVAQAYADASNGLVWDNNFWSSEPVAAAKGPRDFRPYASPVLQKKSGWTSLTDHSLSGPEFAIEVTSPAINNGTNLGSPYNLALDPDNIDFTADPPTIGTLNQDDYDEWDLGAIPYKTISSSSSSSVSSSSVSSSSSSSKSSSSSSISSSSSSSSSSSQSSKSSSSSSESSESSSSSSESSESSSESSLEPQTYYVKNGGDNDDDGLSDATAWETTSHVNSFGFGTGDCIYFKCGDTWTEQQLRITHSGAPGYWVTVGAYYMDGGTETVGVNIDGKPVFDGNEVKPTQAYSGLVQAYKWQGEVSYIIFQDLRIENSLHRGFTSWASIGYPYPDSIHYKRLEVDRTAASGIAAENTINALIENCHVQRTGDATISTAYDPAAILFAGGSTDGIARNNKSHDNLRGEGIGVYFRNERILLEDNVCWNNLAGIEVTHSWEVIARRNLIYVEDISEWGGSCDGILFADHRQDLGAYWMMNCEAYNNIIANVKRGLRWQTTTNSTSTGTKWYNNTLVDCDTSITSGDWSVYPQGEIKNNISWIVDGGGIDAAIDPNCVWDCDNNNWTSAVTGQASGSNDVIGDANLFKTSGWRSIIGDDLDGTEFVPTITSPGTNEGATLGAPYNDALDPDNVDFQTFPPDIGTLDQDTKGAWDMGAFTALVSSSSSSSQSSSSSSVSSVSSSSSSSSGSSSSSSISSESSSSSSSSGVVINYYIDGSAGVDGVGTFASPWNNIASANSFSFTTSDCVYFKVNTTCTPTSPFVIDWEGTASNQVVIGAYYGEEQFGLNGNPRPIIDGQSWTEVGFDQGMIAKLSGTGYITIQDLRINDAAGHGIYLKDISNNVIDNCYLYQTIQQSIVWVNVDSSTISNNTVERQAYETSPGAGIELTGGSDSNTVNNNTVFHCYEGIGVYKGSESNIIEYNTVYDNRQYQIYIASEGRYNTVRYNLVYGSGDATWGCPAAGGGVGAAIVVNCESGWGCEEDGYCADGNEIYGNLVASCPYGIVVTSNCTWFDVKDNLVYNNTVVDCLQNFLIYDTSTGNEFKNNLSWVITGGYVHYNDESPANVTFDTNLHYGGTAVTGNAANNQVTGDPNLSTASGWSNLTAGSVDGTEFSLQGDSAATDAGLNNLGDAYDDALDPGNVDFSTSPPVIGSLLDQDSYGSSWEIGAFVQLGSSSSSQSSSQSSSSSGVSSGSSVSSSSSSVSSISSSSSSSSSASSSSSPVSSSSSSESSSSWQVAGTVTWGHDTGVLEDFSENISDWTGTGTPSLSGDAEIGTINVGEYLESPVWRLGSMEAEILVDEYDTGSGPALTIEYKTGATPTACDEDTWHSFVTSFTSSGWVQIKVSR